MSCDECKEHSGHKTTLELHEKRLDANDIEHREIKESMKLKLSRWIFILVIGGFLGSFSLQMRLLYSIDKNVAVLSERLENHMKIVPSEIRKEAYLTVAGY